MAIEWDKSLSVGVKLIDEQHQELFRMVNDLVGAMLRNEAKGKLGPMLDFLGRYVVQHFGAEEKLMEQYRYPATAAHKRQHADFVKAFTGAKGDFDVNGPTAQLSITVNQFVCDWLREHIAGSDRELGKFLMATGAREARR